MSFDKSYHEIPIGGIIKDPGCSIVNKTGSWRSLKPTIDEDKCTMCKKCWLFCPEGIISWSEDAMVIDYDYCKGCGTCASVCPEEAIEMVLEKK